MFELNEKQNIYIFASPFFAVAQLTAAIRYHQYYVYNDEIHGDARRKYKYSIRVYANRRRQMLRELRSKDYRQFEWLLERLDLFYKPKPTKEHDIVVSRKEGLRQLTKIHCDAVIETKLNEYRDKLEAQQLPFLEQKINNLKFIRNEEIEMGLFPTITEELIQVVQKQYDELKVVVDAKTEAPTKKKWKIF